MHKHFDLLIVGAGLFGAACAYELTKRGFRCLILERRGHIGGNCFTKQRDDINIHEYGPHIFHTSNKPIWDWINQFADFNHYRHRVKINCDGVAYSLPLNLTTFHQLWGVRTLEEARDHLNHRRVRDENTETLEGWMLSQVGREIYEKFFKEYSRKQWGQCPSTLPASIIKRLPIRFNDDDNYFDDAYQGIPIGGYTAIFSKLLSHVEVRLNTDYFSDRRYFNSLARKVLYTGPIDRFFDHRFGKLQYRSMRFEHLRLSVPDFQGLSQVNYASEKVPFTRIIEHKHFEFGRQPVTWVSREYPTACADGQEPMYPVKDEANQRVWEKYRTLSERPPHRRYYFGGRLAAFQYYDMDQVISAALAKLKTIERDLAGPSRACQSDAI